MRASVKKYYSCIQRALELKQKDLWVIMGRTSEWEDEESPDIPSPEDMEIVEPFLAIKPVIVSMAKEITLAEYDQLGSLYREVVSVGGVLRYFQLINDEDAVDENALYLYIQAIYDPDVEGHPAFIEFRSYYVVSGLVPSEGYSESLWLTIPHINTLGNVEYENSGTKVLGGSMLLLPALLQYR